MVVVDASLENYQQLIDGIRPGAKSFFLDLRSDGIEQIGELLRQHQETEVLHLLSHGSPGCLYLGNSQLSLDTLGDYASTLQKWKVKQLLLYGCNVAAGDAGEELMTKLQALTGASLAASTTRTGAAARGGNWRLEWRTPGMKTPLALSAEAQMAYGGILISQQEYQALRALYQSTNGASWSNNTGWQDWNFNSPTPPNDSVVNGWHGVTVASSRVINLELNFNQLTGSIPTELGNLSNLESLLLSFNQLTGSIPTELGNLSNLQFLQLFSNQLTGSIPTELGNLSNLENLRLYSNQLTGSIPTELGNLSNLQFLQLFSNQLTGSIPTELGNLSNLVSLVLFSNQLTGSIPTELGNLSNLVSLVLFSNQLTGSIPTELGNLSNFIWLRLDSNELTGSIPTELGNLSNLRSLQLFFNQLTGSISQEVLDLSAEKRLENPPYVLTEIPYVQLLLGNNLNINISADFRDINNNISSYGANGLPNGLTINSTTGVISGTPTTEGSFTVTVTATDRAGGRGEDEFNITVSIPLNASDYDALRALYNSTSGNNWRKRTGWDVSSPTPPSASVVNSWHGVTVVGDRVTKLSLFNNSLSGTLPSELGSLSNLQVLSLNFSSLSGTLPSELGSLSNLQELWLDRNSLSGTLPSELGSLSNLRKLYLHRNSLSGTLPSELGSLSNLQELSLHRNSLSGTLPSTLGSLSNLQELSLHRNSLSGTLPSTLGSLSNLQNLYLDRNSLSGTLPSELGSLSNLQDLYLFNNSLSGTLPSELGSFSNLQELYLNNNDFRGTIPDSINALSASKRLENPPYVEIQIPDVNALSGEKFNFKVGGNFGDLNNNISSYGANGLPDGLTINSTTGVISGIPTIPTIDGSFTVTVTATDGVGYRGEDEFNITVSRPTSFNLSDSFALNGNFTNLYIGDFNGDNHDDILRQEKGSWSNEDAYRTAEVLLSQGNGNFTRTTLPDSRSLNGNFINLYIGDFNGDNHDDILRQEKGSWSKDDAVRTADVLLSQGNGNFTRTTLPDSFALNGNFTNLYVGDFNGDEKSDILRQEKGSWSKDDAVRTADVLLSQGNGNFTRTTLPDSFALNGNFTNLYVGDFNGDGKSDILRQEKGDWDNDAIRTAEVLLSQGNGNFTRTTLPDSFELKGDLTKLYIEDLDGDDRDEILVQKKLTQEGLSRLLKVLSSNDGRNFTESLLPSALQFSSQSGQLYIADYSGSGQNNDVLVQRSGNNQALLGSITLGSNDYLQGGTGNDSLNGGNGNDWIRGYGGDDTLLGGSDNDTLYGDEGEDILNEGKGHDMLYGNSGSDTFVLARGMGGDTIQDFSDGTDFIRLEGGLSFADLGIDSQNDSTSIKVSASGELLGILSGVDSSLIGASDFV